MGFELHGDDYQNLDHKSIKNFVGSERCLFDIVKQKDEFESFKKAETFSSISIPEPIISSENQIPQSLNLL